LKIAGGKREQKQREEGRVAYTRERAKLTEKEGEREGESKTESE